MGEGRYKRNRLYLCARGSIPGCLVSSTFTLVAELAPIWFIHLIQLVSLWLLLLFFHFTFAVSTRSHDFDIALYMPGLFFVPLTGRRVGSGRLRLFC